MISDGASVLSFTAITLSPHPSFPEQNDIQTRQVLFSPRIPPTVHYELGSGTSKMCRALPLGTRGFDRQPINQIKKPITKT